MRRTLLTLASLLLLTPGAWAELRIVGETKVEPYKLVRLSAEGADGAALIWDVTPEESVDVVEFPSKVLFVAPPGTYKVKLRALRTKDGSSSFETARATVVIGVPTPPVPPVPPAPPVPPTPPPDPAPIPAAGLRVLIVFSAKDEAKMDPAQRDVLYARSVRDYLNGKCPTGPDGKLKEWRIWPDGVATDAAPKLWQDAMRRPRKSLPWILISTGVGGYEGPLPANVDDTLALLKKYGG